MKRIIEIITIVLIAIIAISCEKKEDSIKPYPYNMDIVSCDIQPEGNLYFEQILPNDQGSVLLIPDPAVSYKVEESQRVLIQYYDKGNIDDTTKNIELTQIAAILSDTISNIPLDSINTLRNDILKLATMWRTGNYLNLNIMIDYNNRPHSLGLFYDLNQQQTDTLDVYLRHNNNGDSMGYWAQTYVSYYIPNFNTYQILRINTKMYDTIEESVTMKIKE